ncbi:MAG: hypothetical protein WDO24_14660 [Pseudomonadota bacterium]
MAAGVRTFGVDGADRHLDERVGEPLLGIEQGSIEQRRGRDAGHCLGNPLHLDREGLGRAGFGSSALISWMTPITSPPRGISGMVSIERER